MAELIIAGTLFWQNKEYLLVDPHPLIEREHWMKDTDEQFLVCSEYEDMLFGTFVTQPFVFKASRPFGISERRKGEKVTIQESEKEEAKETEEETHHPDIIEWLNAKAEV